MNIIPIQNVWFDDAVRFRAQASISFGIADVSILVVSVDRAPVPSAYALVAHAA
jgi:hypothetical protein